MKRPKASSIMDRLVQDLVTMRILKLIVSCILFSTGINGQQHIESDMLEISTKTLHYKLNKSERNVTVQSFYISRFPESMQQYKLYLKELDSLNILDVNEHFPKQINLQKIGLDEKEIDFLRNEYFVKVEYDDYPIIGLDYGQILSYLDWKSDAIGKQVLKRLNIPNPKSLSYLELLKKNAHVTDIPIQTEFLIPLEFQLVSAFNTMQEQDQAHKLSNKKRSRLTNEEHEILKRLKLKNIFEYDLSEIKKYNKLDELILERKENPKNGLQLLELKSICSRSENKYSSKIDSKQILKPWRVYNLKI